VDQPFISKGSEKKGKKVSHRSQDSPEEVDAFQKSIKVFERDLGEKEEDNSNRDEDGKKKSLQQ
jgi:hypothetical protein